MIRRTIVLRWLGIIGIIVGCVWLASEVLEWKDSPPIREFHNDWEDLVVVEDSPDGDPNSWIWVKMEPNDCIVCWVDISAPEPNGCEAAIEVVRADPNAIRALCEDGSVCKVIGHCWESRGMIEIEDIDKNEMVYFMQTTPLERTCRICGKTETRSMTEWSGGTTSRQMDDADEIEEIIRRMEEQEEIREKAMNEIWDTLIATWD